jgi:predicted methyltransferase
MQNQRKSSLIVLSRFSVAPILGARQKGQSVAATSTDFGITTAEVHLHAEGVSFASGESLAWGSIEEIGANETACYVVEDAAARPIRAFSEVTGRVYSLMPTESAPTLLVSGIPMHRIKGTDPHRDTLSKIRAVAPIRGRVLDTATGLGYTAVEAAKTADRVVTIELDPVVLEIAQLNPWSRGLFDNPKIEQIVGDAFEEIEQFEPESFSCIIHDPPTVSLAGELYSGDFYRQAFRVLRRNGRMFHYVGDPESAAGARVVRGVLRRLQKAGFTRVVRKPEAFGVVAYR